MRITIISTSVFVNTMFIFCLNIGNCQSIVDEMNITEMIQPLADSGIFRDSDYYNWGSSIIKGKDNKYHVFYSRWPRKLSF